MSIEEQIYTEENANTNHQNQDLDPTFQCHWDDCSEYPANISQLTDHINTHVESNNSCHWRGCDKYGVEQAKFELTAHCANHTHDSYFCPIPECDQEFVNIDELTQHINIEHDLVEVKEGLTQDFVNQTYKYRTPWWFTNEFINTLNEGTNHKLDMETLYNMKFNLDQYKVANFRYKKYLNSNNDVSLIPPFDMNNSYKTIIKNQQTFTRSQKNGIKKKGDDSDDDFENYANDNGNMIGHTDSNSVLLQLSLQSQSLKNYYQEDDDDEESLQKLHAKLSTSLKINKIVTTELSKAISLKRKQYVINQILLDANIELGLPPLPSGKPARVTQDRVDRELLEDENLVNFD